MTLARLFEIALKILTIVGGIDTIKSMLEALGVVVAKAAREESPYLISGTLSTLDKYVRTTGADNLHVLHDGLDAIKADTEAIIAALDGLSAGGGLTTEEHDHLMGLENASEDDIASAVWAFNLSTWNANSGPFLLDAGECLGGSYAHAAQKAGLEGFILPTNPYFAVVTPQGDGVQAGLDWWNWDGDYTPPIPTWTDVQAGESVYAYLHRVYPSEPFSLTGPGALGTTGTVWWQGYYPGGMVQWKCLVTDADLAALYASVNVDLSAITDKLDLIQPDEDTSLTSLNVNEAAIGLDVGSILTLVGILMGGEAELTIQMVLDAIAALAGGEGSEIVVPPVWPGLDNVTLGTPVAFDGNVDVTADMDGVLVNLTVSPTKTGKYILGNVDLWYGLGRISFESDNGDVEPWQYLAFDNGIFAPKTMAHASAVHLQVLGGAEGTVTPWTITPPSPAPAVATAEYDYPTDDDDPAGV